MKKLIIPKINSNNFGGKWILTAFIVGGIIPLLLWLLFHVFVWVLCVAGAIIFLGFISVGEDSHFYKWRVKKLASLSGSTISMSST